jgi:hypothetical protein
MQIQFCEHSVYEFLLQWSVLICTHFSLNNYIFATVNNLSSHKKFFNFETLVYILIITL